ncbi:hypothetical protein B0H14DRAFT_2768476 [Mycena olivaceomarginata]|nr:hypothetical protein B0H14DRAFT_2768476 [Mycena olivaceomarginata]
MKTRSPVIRSYHRFMGESVLRSHPPFSSAHMLCVPIRLHPIPPSSLHAPHLLLSVRPIFIGVVCQCATSPPTDFHPPSGLPLSPWHRFFFSHTAYVCPSPPPYTPGVCAPLATHLPHNLTGTTGAVNMLGIGLGLSYCRPWIWKIDKSWSCALYSLTRSAIGDRENPLSIPGCHVLVCVVCVAMLGIGREGRGAGDGDGGASKLALRRSEFSADCKRKGLFEWRGSVRFFQSGNGS